MAILVSGYFNPTIRRMLGSTDVRYQTNGVYYYWINIKSETGEEYEVPAEINIDRELLRVRKDDAGVPQILLGQAYYLNQADLAEGGSLTFKDDSAISLEKWSAVKDKEGQKWSALLLNRPYAEKSNSLKTKVAFLDVAEISIFLLFIASLPLILKKKKE